MKSGTNGATGLWVTRYDDKIVIQKGSAKQWVKASVFGSTWTIVLTINGNATTFKLNVKQGRIIGVHFTVPPGKKERVLDLEQGSRYPLFL